MLCPQTAPIVGKYLHNKTPIRKLPTENVAGPRKMNLSQILQPSPKQLLTVSGPRYQIGRHLSNSKLQASHSQSNNLSASQKFRALPEQYHTISNLNGKSHKNLALNGGFDTGAEDGEVQIVSEDLESCNLSTDV